LSAKSRRGSARPWPANFLCSELVRVCTKSAETVANLEAIGEREAVVLCEEAMRRGRAVLMRAASCVFRARVAGCRKDEIVPGYRVLLEFQEHVVWDRRIFSPGHLVDVRELARQARAQVEEKLAAERGPPAGICLRQGAA
jgi:hypothetical protein